MMPALGSQLLLAALFVSVGFIGGALICLWWFEHQKQASESGGKAAADKLAGEGKEELRELVRIYRDRISGKLAIELGGKTHTNTRTLSPTQRQDLVKLLPEWAAWLRSENESATQPLAMITPIESQAVSKTPEKLAAAPVQPAQAVGLRSSGTGPLPALVLVDAAASSEPKPQAQKSIVRQINDILQERIPGTPLEGKRVRLVEDFRQGVVVWIGQDCYPGIDTVPDVEIQKAIRSAVSEWENLTEKNRGK